jgi:hypothetical protein
MDSPHFLLSIIMLVNKDYDALTDILRGLAASTLGSFNLRTPSFISASIFA